MINDDQRRRIAARLRDAAGRGNGERVTDGEPIRIGDEVTIDGAARIVLGYRLYDDEMLLVANDENGLIFAHKPSRVRHFGQAPADSWEKLEEDVNLGCRDYCEKHRLEECDYNMRVHLLASAKKLAGIEEEAI